MGSKVTIEQVAQHSGVSLATVSRVLNHPELVSSKTAARVNASIRELNYSSVVGQYNSAEFEGGAGLIMVNIPWLDNPFYSEIVRGIRVAARSAGFDVLVSWDVPTASAVNDYCAMLRRCNASGIITLSPLEAETIERIDSTIPLVQCCEVNPEVDVPFVTIDDFAAARIAVEHLVSCGCSRLAIVSGPDTYKYARGRMDGFLSVAKAHGIDIEDGWIVRVPDNSYGLAHSAVCHMLESANAPDGVFACSDTYGAAVISAARRAGLTVPGDLMVVGFDNTDNAIMTTPTLTTVNQPRYRMGYTACNILLERMKGAAAPQSMTMETELVLRESTTRSRA